MKIHYLNGFHKTFDGKLKNFFEKYNNIIAFSIKNFQNFLTGSR